MVCCINVCHYIFWETAKHVILLNDQFIETTYNLPIVR